jgi:hypothetical protein
MKDFFYVLLTTFGTAISCYSNYFPFIRTVVAVLSTLSWSSLQVFGNFLLPKYMTLRTYLIILTALNLITYYACGIFDSWLPFWLTIDFTEVDPSFLEPPSITSPQADSFLQNSDIPADDHKIKANRKGWLIFGLGCMTVGLVVRLFSLY